MVIGENLLSADMAISHMLGVGLTVWTNATGPSLSMCMVSTGLYMMADSVVSVVTVGTDTGDIVGDLLEDGTGGPGEPLN